MRIGLWIDELAPSLDDMISFARAHAAFDSLWAGQRDGRDALTALAVVGRAVRGPALGTAVVPTQPRHPLALAAQALTAQEAVGGRLTLGVGVSHRPIVEGRFGLPYERPARHLREYLSVLAPLLRGESVAFEGETLKASGAVGVPTTAPSLLVGALGPASLRIAGELADGVVTTWAGPEALESYVIPALGGGAPRVVATVCVCVTGDEAGVRAMVAEQFAVVNELPAYRAILERGGARGPADVIVAGDEADVLKQLGRLAGAGATELLAVPIGTPEEQERTTAFLAGAGV
ncbi:TIGR03564 family F420-dependent LLM class oxidoreductase [Nonomuraea sp. NPDC050663]|uniref:TIGR03564 family F420-dependent LLM class oxidoreductase n=1 Tax=Nonomuraea sp. NPDC050663 TaxID=3364370 RepID=UPI0037A924DC